MGSVNSPSSNLSNLLQTLSAESPVLSSVLSAPGVQTALAKQPAGDLVQLSDEAVKMQEASLLFASPATPVSASDSILQALQSSLTNEAEAAGASVPATSSLANQTTSIASTSQAQELAALFGTGSTVDPFFNIVG